MGQWQAKKVRNTTLESDGTESTCAARLATTEPPSSTGQMPASKSNAARVQFGTASIQFLSDNSLYLFEMLVCAIQTRASHGITQSGASVSSLFAVREYVTQDNTYRRRAVPGLPSGPARL